MAAKLCLGTVQFGMRYGVHNALGRQPTDAEVFAVLDAARDAGIDAFDTASAYGTAEDVLGRYRLASRGVRIISKLRPHVKTADTVLHEMQESLRRLGTDHIACYMLHRAEDLGNTAVMEGLTEVKACGWAEKIGVSVYRPEDALRAAEDSRIDAIQIPYNALDQRLDACGFFVLAKKHGKEIYARSAFLQGLLLMQPQEAEHRVSGSGAYVAAFQKIARDMGFLPNEAAMLYVLRHEGIDYVVFGVDTAAQLQENVRLSERVSEITDSCCPFIGKFNDVPQKLIDPSLW